AAVGGVDGHVLVPGEAGVIIEDVAAAVVVGRFRIHDDLGHQHGVRGAVGEIGQPGDVRRAGVAVLEAKGCLGGGREAPGLSDVAVVDDVVAVAAPVGV